MHFSGFGLEQLTIGKENGMLLYGQTNVCFPQVTQGQKPNQKPMKDPNAPKKPLSAYFLFSQEERLKVKAEFPDYSITEVAKELGRRWATIDPAVKQSYEQRYQVSNIILVFVQQFL